MDVEQRVEQLERQNKRFKMVLALLAVALCAVVTMAATDRDGEFDTVTARYIWVKNDAGERIVILGANDSGNGLIYTQSASGGKLVMLNSAVGDHGAIQTFAPSGKELVDLSAATDGYGSVTTFAPSGKELVKLNSTVDGSGSVTMHALSGKELVKLTTTDNGGFVEVFNKTGETIVQLGADDYGNGEVGVWNRKGKGRVYDSK